MSDALQAQLFHLVKLILNFMSKYSKLKQNKVKAII